jgi:hypothetical protein
MASARACVFGWFGAPEPRSRWWDGSGFGRDDVDVVKTEVNAWWQRRETAAK